MTTRFTDGNVTIALDDGLERLVRDLLSAAETETVRILEAAAEEVAAEARGKWYTMVDKETGRSGDIQVVTTFDTGRGEVRVSVGSTDTRKAGSKPLPVYVHKPGWLSVKPRAGTKGRPPNPKANDGAFLLVELVRKPTLRKVKLITPELGRAIAARVNGGS